MLQANKAGSGRRLTGKLFLRSVLAGGLLATACSGLPASAQEAFSLSVVGSEGQAISRYRWVLEEDVTYAPAPGDLTSPTLSTTFHKSYMPVVAEGTEEDVAALAGLIDPAKRYFLSVRPESGFSQSGVAIAPGDRSVELLLESLPIPTAQISVFVFNDNAPVNNAPDTGEAGLEGFKVILSEAGGRYGAVGGQILQDAFGNPLGTTYDEVGNVLTLGDGTITTDANGRALIKYLVPAKYGVVIEAPPGTDWRQTTTIEGTRTIDAWVKANEPQFFTEFGPPGEHVFVGFIQPTNDTTVLTGGTQIEGQVTNLHLGRPPNYSFHSGAPFDHTTCWVGLNEGLTGTGRAIYAQRCGEEGFFSIPNVPDGDYQLVIWDDNLDIIIASLGLHVEGGACNDLGTCNLGSVPVYNWFHALLSSVFYDTNGNGFWDPGEMPMPEVPVNIRFRDGTLYQSFATDMEGNAPFEEVFPFFNWLVAEVDFTNHAATGATIVVDAGGPVPPHNGWHTPSFDRLNPQPQAENNHMGNNLFRTVEGPVLTQAFQGFLGQTNVIQWGKRAYAPGQNGGISGMVHYATTRAEDDPRYAAADPWEPGIPRVQVTLYRDADGDGVADDVDGDGAVVYADVDNYPFDWTTSGVMGPEDEDRTVDGVFTYGDAIQITTTDSWDDSLPTGCVGVDPCHDGLHAFNQVRDGVFDGGFAFDSHFPNGMGRADSTEVAGLPQGYYIVEARPPQGYQTVKEENKNVDFGETFVPSPELLPAVCVGDPHLVPAYLSFSRDELIPAPYAGHTRPLCDRKQVRLNDQANAAVNFFMFTETPIAAHAVGFILDDLANEFDRSSPQFGEKYAPPFLPVSIRDWTGREIHRVYSDRNGTYNFLLPSTYTVNAASPSGLGPSMYILCMNDPGPIPTRATEPGEPAFTVDPFFNRNYSQFCYTFQFVAGTTTYLDTPVLPVAAFAGPDQFPLLCELPDGTPGIYSVRGATRNGPYVLPGETLTITSQGIVQVPNPAYDGTEGSPKTIPYDYGFGTTPGRVLVGNVELTNVAWADGVITGTVPDGAVTGELVVERADGKRSLNTVTVTVGPIKGTVWEVQPSPIPSDTPIQNAIEMAKDGDLILVAPGNYPELVILTKDVSLQGSGAGSTIINATIFPGEKLAEWRQRIRAYYADKLFDILPGQEVPADPAEEIFVNEEGAAILVLDTRSGKKNPWRIDGFTITSGTQGGGIVVNGHTDNLEISNNRIVNNYGASGGGIRVGHHDLVVDDAYVDADNDGVYIHDNQISYNGALGGAGAGVSLYTGSDGYRVTDNFICGNFSQGTGAGVGHLGLSPGGVIAGNTIAFNQTFNQGLTVSGGGVLIAGQPSQTPGEVGPGSGSVLIQSNLIQGNLAGAGDGGGIRLERVNGEDVARNKKAHKWHRVDIVNNIIANNVAGLAGGAISLEDAVNTFIDHNTIAHNDSTATAGAAFPPGSPKQSAPQPAGIVGHAHSSALLATGNTSGASQYFSNPSLTNNIVWRNRSFYFLMDDTVDPPRYLLMPDVEADPNSVVYADLAVLGYTGGQLQPMNSVLTDTTGYDASNISDDPQLADPYFNSNRNSVVMGDFTTAIEVQPAFDEGGNFIDVRFGPLTITGDYSADLDFDAGSDGNVGAPQSAPTGVGG